VSEHGFYNARLREYNVKRIQCKKNITLNEHNENVAYKSTLLTKDTVLKKFEAERSQC
jgi:hypothetical protein